MTRTQKKTGAPKKYRMASCHPDKPHSARGLCQQCYTNAKQRKDWVPLGRQVTPITCGHPDRRHVGHGRCPSCYAKHLRATHEKYSKGARASEEMWRRYMITMADRDQMIERQGGVCCLCDLPFGTNRIPHIDHCHKTGFVRGILCFSCNQALGKFGDSVAGLLRALEYLERAERARLDAELEARAA